MRLSHLSATALCIIIMCLTACSAFSTEELLRQQLDAIDPADAVLVYEYVFTSSAATGACLATYIDQWYGSEFSFNEIQRVYEKQLVTNGWETWPRDVVEIWRRESPQGVYSMFLEDASVELEPERASYTLPSDVVAELVDYPTAYLVRLGFMRTSQAKKCSSR